jgi:O-antigen ligase
VARVDRDWLRRRRAGLWIGLSLLGVAALFVAQIVLRIHADPTSGTFDQDPRWEIWARALDNIRTGPWSGSGFGRGVFTRLNPDVVARNGLHWHAHNTWLNKGVQMGFPGIAAFALLLVAAAWRAWLPRAAIRSDPGAGMLSASGIALLAGLFVKNMTDDFFVRDQGYLFWVLMAAIAAALEPLRRASHAPGNSVAVQNR